ncbi:MAG: NADH-ubiquinone oxidoreductase-F iron-sulfur binding region domain-containing protein [Candidatus Paceibacterota bacterium]
MGQEEAQNITDKIEAAGLVGRGGAEYPTAKKWREVKEMESDKKYVICNASEGEIGLFKDIYILENHLEKVVKGVILALDYIGAETAYFNINRNYYDQVGGHLQEITNEYNRDGYDIRSFIEEPSYIGGEETALLNAIEGERTEPRLKPPFPSEKGLHQKPTLINNVETLFNVASVEEGSYEGKRFYCISGAVKNGGVYHLPEDQTIEKILRETGNFPSFDFFVQIGGSASGVVYNSRQIKEITMTGAGGLEVYHINSDPRELLLKWFSFYQRESCGKCIPCSQGSFNLKELTENHHDIPWEKIFKILDNTDKASFCGLGRSISNPIRSFYSNVLNNDD